jgi:hypothetical protein
LEYSFGILPLQHAAPNPTAEPLEYSFGILLLQQAAPRPSDPTVWPPN